MLMYDINRKRLFFNSDGRIETKHIKLMSIMGDRALRRPDFFEGGLNYFNI